MFFPLAPMSLGIRILTAVLLGLPVLFVVMSLTGGGGPVLLPMAGALGLIYGAAWVWLRPKGFRWNGGDLVIVFPGRQRKISGATLGRGELVDLRDLRKRLGFPIRIGVGGLWGGFGWLWSRRGGLVEMYIARTSEMVWIERSEGSPLLLTPERSEEFLATLHQPGRAPESAAGIVPRA